MSDTAPCGGELVLSVFPGIDLLGQAFEEKGFCVVRGPDLLWGGDIHTFHPPAGKFDGVIGGPPCQFFSRLRLLVKSHGGDVKHGNLIPEFARIVIEAQPQWFLMENVPEAPIPDTPGYVVEQIVLDNRWIGGQQHRRRRFIFGLVAPFLEVDRGLADFPLLEIDWVALEYPLSEGEKLRVVPAGGGGGYNESMPYEQRCRLQGLPEDFLADSPFTKRGKQEMIGNAVPLPMGRAIAQAVKVALGYST